MTDTDITIYLVRYRNSEMFVGVKGVPRYFLNKDAAIAVAESINGSVVELTQTHSIRVRVFHPYLCSRVPAIQVWRELTGLDLLTCKRTVADNSTRTSFPELMYFEADVFEDIVPKLREELSKLGFILTYACNS